MHSFLSSSHFPLPKSADPSSRNAASKVFGGRLAPRFDRSVRSRVVASELADLLTFYARTPAMAIQFHLSSDLRLDSLKCA
jgi:hypothetical protein